MPVLGESISSQKYTFFSELEKLTRPATRNNIMVLPALTQHRDRPPDPTFRKSRNFGIARRTEGVGRGTAEWRQGTHRRMHRDYSGSRGMREPEENEFGIGKNSLEYQNRMNSRRLCSLHPRIQKTDSLKRIQRIIKKNSLIPFS